ncbi:MAG: chloramphenicol O-acetyltransferase type A [Flavobacteriales bacterium]|jgi:chloramphenicol O-acetyltransferase type A
MQKIDLNTWKRREHFEFFQSFEEPFFGITMPLDVSKAYAHAKSTGISFFLYYLHASLRAANTIENFAYRIDKKGQPFICDPIGASATILRDNETFGFSNIPFHEDFHAFAKAAQAEIARVKASGSLFPPDNPVHVMHCSSLPWIDFSSITHSRNFKDQDGIPKLSYGKVKDTQGIKTMSLAVYVHHGLVDGLHVSRFVSTFQDFLNA